MILAGESGNNRWKPCPITTSSNTIPINSGMGLKSGLPVRLLLEGSCYQTITAELQIVTNGRKCLFLIFAI
jgi:hypothetical protein